MYTKASVELAWPMLSILAPSVFFVCMLSVTSSFLQACGREKYPIISMSVGCVVKLAASYILIGIPSIGRFGTPIGTFICYLVITVLNFYFVVKYTGVKPNIANTFMRPFVSAITAVGLAAAMYYAVAYFWQSRIVTLLAILAAALIYVVVVLRFRALSREDIMLIPKGERICGLLEKMKLLPKTVNSQQEV